MIGMTTFAGFVCGKCGCPIDTFENAPRHTCEIEWLEKGEKCLESTDGRFFIRPEPPGVFRSGFQVIDTKTGGIRWAAEIVRAIALAHEMRS